MLALLFGLYYDVAEKKQSQTERSAFMAEEMKDLLQNNAPENAEAVTESAAEGTENAERPKISMPAKEDILYEVDVHMNTSVLYDYMLRHTYTSPGGLIATIILYLIAGIVIILYLPWNLYLSAKRQALTNEAFKKPLHYIFTKEGIYVSQGDQVEMQHWENMHQAVATGKSIIIYTSKVNASIFPRADLAENTVTVIELICRYMDPKKVKIRQ